MAEIDPFDEGFKPSNGTLEDLTDGEYEFECDVGERTQPASLGYPLITLPITVLTPGKHAGQRIAHKWFIADSDAKGRFGRDLKALGFDTTEWNTPPRKGSEELAKALACLKGIRFTATKKTAHVDAKNGKPAKDFHNLNGIKRNLKDGLPAVFGEAELNQGNAENVIPF